VPFSFGSPDSPLAQKIAKNRIFPLFHWVARSKPALESRLIFNRALA
jgi:hypothetical protein